MRNYHRIYQRLCFLLIFGVFNLSHLFAESSHADAPAVHGITTTFLWIVIILLAAKFSSLVEKLGQPPVLGELLIGVVMGNLALVGIHQLEAIKTDSIITFFSELGVVLLLFQVGLESSVQKMFRVGFRATLVACVGVVLPFLAGIYILGPLFFPGAPFNAHLFLGATLTATSVGITARVFQDLKTLQTPEAQIVLGAAVIDDVIGLIILAVVTAIVTTGTIGIGAISLITAKAAIFLVGAIAGGYFLAPKIGKFLSLVHSGSGMKFTLAISFCLIFAFTA
ncbi:MAG: cation:proton antiporter, partial [Chlamydiota bacterium]|nr:cation:proton antiporter [Chlamydiota bacterium]